MNQLFAIVSTRTGVVTQIRQKPHGFSIIEALVGIVVFCILTLGLFGTYNAVQNSYATARQLNEMYTVLSACPEINRALDYTSLDTGTNCYPNNSFQTEHGVAGANIQYSPNLSVTETSDLPVADPLQGIPDSKVVKVTLNFLSPYSSFPPLELRLLITRNGVGQQ